MTNIELREFSDNDLTNMVIEDKAALDKLKFAHYVSGIENPAKIMQLRRKIARIKTILTQRKKGIR
ncbi:MAG: 50S ribosomal protein L29 [Bacteroidia bacterium]|nr:50S ribosomal protein L29 [Bacteroidia bacterium]